MIGGARTNRLLVGHFLDHRHFCTCVMQSLVNELWHTNQLVVVVVRKENSFIFRFYDAEDMEYALVGGPWAIRGGLLILDYWRSFDRLADIKVREYALWVQLYNLPFEAFIVEAGEILGEALGEYVHVDVDEAFPRHFRYLRLRVSVTPDSTLAASFYLELPDCVPRWIECRYERVYKLFRTCGRVGHTYPNVSCC